MADSKEPVVESTKQLTEVLKDHPSMGQVAYEAYFKLYWSQPAQRGALVKALGDNPQPHWSDVSQETRDCYEAAALAVAESLVFRR